MPNMSNSAYRVPQYKDLSLFLAKYRPDLRDPPTFDVSNPETICVDS